MKILMIAPQPFFSPRGTPFSVLHRLRALSRLEHQVDLVTYHLGESVPIAGVRYFRIPRVPFVGKISIGPSYPKIILDLLVLARAVALLWKNDYDLMHTHEEAGFFGTFLAKIFGVKHLYDMHSSLPQQLTNFKFTKSSFLLRMFEALESWTLRNADGAITICPELYNYVDEHYPDVHQVLIENVADNASPFQNGDPPKAEDYLPQPNGHTVVLYAGTFEPYQGLDLLIESSQEVVERHPETMFVLAGGNPDQVAHYKAQVAERSLSDHFVFTGMVPPQVVPLLVDRSDVLVSPRIEGNNTPLKIYSYLRSGKPIVATRHLTHTQVLTDDVAVLTECSAEAFGGGILKVIEDETSAAEIVAHARDLAEREYSYQRYLEKTRAILDHIASK